MTGQDDQNLQSTPVSSPQANEVIESVRELISMMSKGGISELDLTTGDVSIRLRSQNGMVAATTTMIPVTQALPHPEPVAATVPEGQVITSPMIGTYYAAPAPGEASFVQVGDEVQVGQVIGIIEAMKIMNEITADHSGVVVDIMVQNAQPVEYGSPLLRVVPSDNFE